MFKSGGAAIIKARLVSRSITSTLKFSPLLLQSNQMTNLVLINNRVFSTTNDPSEKNKDPAAKSEKQQEVKRGKKKKVQIENDESAKIEVSVEGQNTAKAKGK